MSLRDALREPIWERRDRSAPGIRVRAGAVTVADVVAPAGVHRRHAHRVIVGDSYLSTLRAATFPPRLHLGWLNAAALRLDEPGVLVHQRIEPVNDVLARRLLGRSVSAAYGTLANDTQRGGDEDVDAEQGMAAANALRRDLAAGDDRLFGYGVWITVAAASDAAREEGVDGVRHAAAQEGLALQAAPFSHWQGYLQSLPLGRDTLGLLHDASGWAVAMGLPTAAPGLPRQGGGLPLRWGVHPRTGEPVLWDRWRATNPHALVIAESGSGKTYSMSGLLAQEVALGDDALLILDPKRHEYAPLVRGLGGAYVSLSALADYHINPLELPRLSAERLRAVATLREDVLGQRISFVRALLVGELRANGTAVDGWGIVLIERAILAAYSRHGIAADDPGSWVRPMPTFSAVRRELEALAEGETGRARDEATDLARAMSLWTDGTIGRLFNHPSNVPTDHPVLALDLHALLDGNDPMLGRIIPVVVADFFRLTALNRPTGRHYHLVLDEAHALLGTDAGGHALQNIYRTGRSLGFKATVMTQGLRDLQRSAHTETLLENSRTKLILGLNRDSGAVRDAAALLNLNDQEAAYLAQCQLTADGAWALLLADGHRTRLHIPPWPPTLHRIITASAVAQDTRR